MAYCSSYYLYQRYEKRGDQDWIPSYPNVYSIDGEGSKPLRARQMYDTDCGWIPDTEPIYRWTEIAPTSDPSTYWCDDCSSEYSGQYLTFVAVDSGTFSFSGTSYSTINNSSILYSTDNGSTWYSLSRGVQSPTISAGNKIMWKSTSLQPINDGINYDGIGKFSSTGRFNVEGNAMSLYYGDNFANQTSLSGKDGALSMLFKGCTGLISSENLVLPATNLARDCYYRMFSGCTSLTTAVSILPATTLAKYCYFGMFENCQSLTTAPQLPATSLAEACYANMFQDCESLTVAPVLPATNLSGAYGCYNLMFYECNSLTTAPQLPATTLSNMCYAGMFDGCNSLTTAPELPATTLAEMCYTGMFNGCSGLTTAPDLSATTLVQACYQWMFIGCTSLNYVKCLATNISASDCTDDWLYGVASSGTFVKNSSMSNWPSGISGIPSGWTVQNAT